MTVGDALVLMLSANTDGLARGLQDAQHMVDGASKTLARALMEPLKSAFGFLATGLSLGALTQQYLREADAIGKQAEAIGVDIEELQHWSNAAELAGGSAEGFQSSLQTMNRHLQMAAEGQGQAANAFSQFGVKIKDGSGKARDALDVMRDLAGAFEKMDKQKALAMGQRIGLDRGTIMLLQSGKAKLEDLLKAQKELGAYTKEDEEIAHKANEEIKKLKQTLKMVAAEVLRHVVPALRWLGEKLNKGIKFLRQHKPFVMAFIAGTAALITAKMIPALKKMALANAAAWAPFLLAAAIIGGLALLFDDWWGYIHGDESALEGLWETLGEGPEQLANLQRNWENFKKSVSGTWETVNKNVQDFLKYFDTGGMFNDAMKSVEGIAHTVHGLFNFDYKEVGKGIGQSFSGAFGIVEKSFTGLIKYFSKGGEGEISWAWFETSFDKALKNMGSFWDGFLSGLSPEARTDIKTLWEGISGGWEEFKRDIEDFVPDFSKWKERLDEFFDEVKKMLKEKFPNLAKFFDFMDKMEEEREKIIQSLPDADEQEELSESAVRDFTEKHNPDTTVYLDKDGQEQRRKEKKQERQSWHKTKEPGSVFDKDEKKEEEKQEGIFTRALRSFEEVMNGIAKETAEGQEEQSADGGDDTADAGKSAFFGKKDNDDGGVLTKMFAALSDVLAGVAKNTAMDSVPAEAMVATNNIDRSVTVNDYKRVQITVEAAANPEATGQSVKRQFEEKTNTGRQAAYGVAQA